MEKRKRNPAPRANTLAQCQWCVTSCSCRWSDAKSFIHLDVKAGAYSKLTDTVDIVLAEEAPLWTTKQMELMWEPCKHETSLLIPPDQSPFLRTNSPISFVSKWRTADKRISSTLSICYQLSSCGFPFSQRSLNMIMMYHRGVTSRVPWWHMKLLLDTVAALYSRLLGV